MNGFSKTVLVCVLSVGLAYGAQAQSPNPNITTGPTGVKTVTGGGDPGTPPAKLACNNLAKALGVPNLNGCTAVPIGPNDGTVAVLAPNGNWCYFDPTANGSDQGIANACNKQFPKMGF